VLEIVRGLLQELGSFGARCRFLNAGSIWIASLDLVVWNESSCLHASKANSACDFRSRASEANTPET